MATNKNTTWKDVRSILVKKEKPELLNLIRDLYLYRNDNKTFIHSRYFIGKEPLEAYRKIITESLYPDVYSNKPIRLSRGKKAISDYFKATKDKNGKLELMVHYFETGNKFTVEIGDINEQFYSSLESMFERILSTLKEQPPEVQEKYYSRLEDIVNSARNIGWGYYDYIRALLDEYEINTDST